MKHFAHTIHTIDDLIGETADHVRIAALVRLREAVLGMDRAVDKLTPERRAEVIAGFLAKLSAAIDARQATVN